jgi:hypothetical protein
MNTHVLQLWLASAKGAAGVGALLRLLALSLGLGALTACGPGEVTFESRVVYADEQAQLLSTDAMSITVAADTTTLVAIAPFGADGASLNELRQFEFVPQSKTSVAEIVAGNLTASTLSWSWEVASARDSVRWRIAPAYLVAAKAPGQAVFDVSLDGTNVGPFTVIVK